MRRARSCVLFVAERIARPVASRQKPRSARVRSLPLVSTVTTSTAKEPQPADIVLDQHRGARPGRLEAFSSFPVGARSDFPSGIAQSSFFHFLRHGYADGREGRELLRARLLTALFWLAPLGVVAVVQSTIAHGFWPRGWLLAIGTAVLACPSLLLWRGFSLRLARGVVVLPYLALVLTGLVLAGGLGTATSHHLAPWLMITMMLYGRRTGAAAVALVSLAVMGVGWWSLHYPCPSELALRAAEIPTAVRGVLVTTWTVFGFLLLYELQRASYERELRRIAQHDELTGLPTRSLYLDRLDQAIARAHRFDTIVAVFLFDLDGFKPINDTYGHHAGDMLLREMAERARGTLREADTVARLGGDEFVGFAEIQSPADFECFLVRLSERLREPVDYEGVSLEIGASLGYCFYPQDGTSAEELIRVADQRMYQIKRDRVRVPQRKSKPRPPLLYEENATRWAAPGQLG